MIHVILKQQKRSGYSDWTLSWQDHTKGIGRVGKLSKRDAERARREFEAKVNRGEVATPARRSGVGTLADFRARGMSSRSRTSSTARRRRTGRPLVTCSAGSASTCS